MKKCKIECPAKHTKYQPTDAEWKCPKFKSTEEFYIDEPVSDVHDDCSLLHEEDFIVCRNCDSTYFGKNLAKKLQDKVRVVTCPCCKGTGLMKDTRKKG